jgi:hypothetical protein
VDALVALTDPAERRSFRAWLEHEIEGTVSTASTTATLLRKLHDAPDLLVVDASLARPIGAEFVSLVEQAAPDAMVLFHLPRGWRTPVEELGWLVPGRTDVVGPAQSEALLRHRVRSFVVELKRRPSTPTAGGTGRRVRAGPAKDHMTTRLLALHDPNTGRLDAERLARFYHLPLKELATAIGRRPGTVHKTPASESLQPSLRAFREVAEEGLLLFDDEAGFLAWLRTPHPDLDGAAPIDLLRAGRVDAVVRLLRFAAMGVPA